MRVGITELLIVLAIVLLMFGSKKLPELADGMGKAIRNFKRGVNSEDEEDVTPVTPADKQVQAQSSAHANDVTSEARNNVTAERKG